MISTQSIGRFSPDTFAGILEVCDEKENSCLACINGYGVVICCGMQQ